MFWQTNSLTSASLYGNKKYTNTKVVQLLNKEQRGKKGKRAREEKDILTESEADTLVCS